jgi:hypothetical protein
MAGKVLFISVASTPLNLLVIRMHDRVVTSKPDWVNDHRAAASHNAEM